MHISQLTKAAEKVPLLVALIGFPLLFIASFSPATLVILLALMLWISQSYLPPLYRTQHYLTLSLSPHSHPPAEAQPT